MDILNNPTVSILKNALDGFATRSQAIMTNIANADTPNYKQVKVTFEDKLRAELEKTSAPLMDNKTHALNTNGQLEIKITDPRHIIGYGEGSTGFVNVKTNNHYSYRNDKNNVDIEQEMTDLAKTALSYKAVSNLEYKEFGKMKMLLEKTQ